MCPLWYSNYCSFLHFLLNSKYTPTVIDCMMDRGRSTNTFQHKKYPIIKSENHLYYLWVVQQSCRSVTSESGHRYDTRCVFTSTTITGRRINITSHVTFIPYVVSRIHDPLQYSCSVVNVMSLPVYNHGKIMSETPAYMVFWGFPTA